MQRTIVVGDVHGCRDELTDILKAASWTRADRLVLAGDLVAKGPDSQGVVQLARETGALAVLGNHDAHVLRARATGLGSKGKPIRPEHQQVLDTLTAPDWAYLEAMPLFLRLGSLPDGAEAAVIHAGAVPGKPLEDQSREDLITMRSIARNGSASKKIEGTPWAKLWSGPERLIFGHDAVRGLQQEEMALGIDTGCVYGFRLTAVVLPEWRLVQIPARHPYAEF